MSQNRAAFRFNIYVNKPILSLNGRILGNTGFLFPVLIFMDSIFGEVDPPQMTLNDYDTSGYTGYNEYPYYDSGYYNPTIEGGGYIEYPNGHSSYSQVGSGYSSYSRVGNGYSSYSQVTGHPSRNSWASETHFQSHPGSYGARPQVVFGDHRSLAEDQKTIYEHLAASLSAVGVDGRGCLLRFICEAQLTRIKKLNLLGKLLATLLTPKDDNFLEEYNRAATLGKSEDKCANHFETCPISLFNIFNFIKSPKTSKSTKKSLKNSTASSGDHVSPS